MAQTSTSPSSQKAHAIGLLLWDDRSHQAVGKMFTLPIRPEELNYTEPTRITTQATLAGAYADIHGWGIKTLTVTGHTGWRGNSSGDGAALFKTMKTDIFDEYHRRRAEMLRQLRDPNDLQMLVSDKHHGYTWVAAPKAFTLRRHKSSPLLHHFALSFDLLGVPEDFAVIPDPIMDAINNPRIRRDAASKHLQDQKTTLQELNDDLNAYRAEMDAAFGPITDYLQGINDTIAGYIDVITGFVDATLGPILAVADSLVTAAHNIGRLMLLATTLAQKVKGAVMRLCSAWNDIRCTLRNAWQHALDFPSFSDLLNGASNCSSTGGGSAPSAYRSTKTNTVEAVRQAQATPPATPTVSTAARASMSAVSVDPIAQTSPPTDLAQHARSISEGVSLAA